MSTLTLNIPYSRKVLEHLIAHPEEHDQSVFGLMTSCGTKACIAGAAVIMDPDSQVLWRAGQMTWVVANGKGWPIDERARTLFGLSVRDANNLFYYHTFDNEGALEMLAALIAAAEAVQYE